MNRLYLAINQSHINSVQLINSLNSNIYQQLSWTQDNVQGLLKKQNKCNEEMEIVKTNVQHAITKQHETISRDEGERGWKTKLKEEEANNESLRHQVEKLNDVIHTLKNENEKEPSNLMMQGFTSLWSCNKCFETLEQFEIIEQNEDILGCYQCDYTICGRRDKYSPTRMLVDHREENMVSAK